MLKPAIMLMTVVTFSSGCVPNSSPTASTNTEKQTDLDPIEGFRAIVPNHPVTFHTSEKYDESRPSRAYSHTQMTMRDFKFDVKKTDSLVEPMVGMIDFAGSSTIVFSESKDDFDFSAGRPSALLFRMRYTWSGTAWELKTFETTYDVSNLKWGDLGKAFGSEIKTLALQELESAASN